MELPRRRWRAELRRYVIVRAIQKQPALPFRGAGCFCFFVGNKNVPLFQSSCGTASSSGRRRVNKALTAAWWLTVMHRVSGSSRRSRDIRAAEVSSSSWLVASSKNSTSGRAIRARAMLSRCCSPPESRLAHSHLPSNPAAGRGSPTCSSTAVSWASSGCGGLG